MVEKFLIPRDEGENSKKLWWRRMKRNEFPNWVSRFISQELKEDREK